MNISDLEKLSLDKREKTNSLQDVMGCVVFTGIFILADRLVDGTINHFSMDLAGGSGLYAGTRGNPLKGIYGLAPIFSVFAYGMYCKMNDQLQCPLENTINLKEIGDATLLAYYGCSYIAGKVASDFYRQARYKVGTSMVGKIIDKINVFGRDSRE